MTLKEKAEEYLRKEGWAADPEHPCELGLLKEIYQAGYKEALEWVLEFMENRTEIVGRLYYMKKEIKKKLEEE